MRGQKAQEVHRDYEGFTEKFKPKKTTDDCYTPPAVYDDVLAYCQATFDLDGRTIDRPFYPGGDYQRRAADYNGDTVVIDNPPFSQLAAIRRFYLARGIGYFLFAPALTVMSSDIPDSIIGVGVTIIYENGAKISTAFVTNLFPEPRLVASGTLYRLVRDSQQSQKANLPQFDYPRELITATKLSRLSKAGEEWAVPLQECQRVSRLDAQIPMRKWIYGGGFLCAKGIQRPPREGAIQLDLSARERAIVEGLQNSKNERA